MSLIVKIFSERTLCHCVCVCLVQSDLVEIWNLILKIGNIESLTNTEFVVIFDYATLLYCKLNEY